MLTGGGEGILGGELPHACAELREAADEEGHADDDVGRRDVVGLHVDEGEDERRRREGEQAAVVGQGRPVIKFNSSTSTGQAGEGWHGGTGTQGSKIYIHAVCIREAGGCVSIDGTA